MDRSRTDKQSRNRQNTSNTLTFSRKNTGKSAPKPPSSQIDGIGPVDEKELEALAESTRLDPEVDTARVVALHDRIQHGSYYIDSARVAEKLLDFESQLQK